MAMGVTVSSRLVSVLMTQAGIYGLPGPARVKRLRGVVTSDDLVNRKFHQLRPNELWVTDIAEHPTREGKVYCAAVLDAFSRRIIGWSIDSRQDTTLVINALDMAIQAARPGRYRPRRPRRPVHRLGLRRPGPQGRPHAVIRQRR